MIDQTTIPNPDTRELGPRPAPSRDAHDLAEYPPFQRAVEIFSIGAFTVLAGVTALRLWRAAEGADYWLLAATVPLGYLCADFFSGLVHWGFDTWGSIHTPIAGKNWIRPFREHHVDPKAITRHDFVETNGNNCLVSLPALLLTASLPYTADGWFAMAFGGTMLFNCIGVLGTNQFHKWAHTDEPPRLVRWLQDRHLILPTAHHDIHHRAPYETHYCITTGWLNPILRATGFFRHLERAITALTGAKPREDDLA